MSATPGQRFREVWTADFYNRLNDFMSRAGKVTISGPGFATMSRGGTTIALPRTRASGGGVSATPPWFPIITADNSGNKTATLTPGTIGGVIPGNMFTALALTQSAVNYVYAAMSATSGAVTAATLAASTSYPAVGASTSGSPPTSFNVPIALFDLSVSPKACYNIAGFGNIWCQPYVTLLTTTNTGTLLTAPFTPSYSWEWGAGN